MTKKDNVQFYILLRYSTYKIPAPFKNLHVHTLLLLLQVVHAMYYFLWNLLLSSEANLCKQPLLKSVVLCVHDVEYLNVYFIHWNRKYTTATDVWCTKKHWEILLVKLWVSQLKLPHTSAKSFHIFMPICSSQKMQKKIPEKQICFSQI